MKIFCIDKNYRPKEKSATPIVYMKPETALTREDWPFFVPDWSEQVVCETGLAVRINHLGKSIPERFAHRYYDEVTLGLMFTARDIQNQLKEKGLPWEISTGFDGASYFGKWLKIDKPAFEFSTQLNGELCQQATTADMLHSIDEIVSYVSQFYLLKTGDLIFTGSPDNGICVKEGDLITATLEGTEVLQCRCK